MTPLKVLLIEDEREMRQALRAMLEAGGCLVAEASRGDIGVELAKRFLPDVLLLDLLLPGMSGEQVLQHLKRDVVMARFPSLSSRSCSGTTADSPHKQSRPICSSQ